VKVKVKAEEGRQKQGKRKRDEERRGIKTIQGKRLP